VALPVEVLKAVTGLVVEELERRLQVQISSSVSEAATLALVRAEKVVLTLGRQVAHGELPEAWRELVAQPGEQETDEE
jgi:hypothetical protein